MGFYYQKFVRPRLFRMDPEEAHHFAAGWLMRLHRHARVCRRLARFNQRAGTRPVELFGLRFPNAVGLAAGMDKDAEFWRAGCAMGFGHVEVGTLTQLAQPGNPRPRVFRYPREEALINRMGFNNAGAEAAAGRLRGDLAARARPPGILGVSIGKSRAVPLDEAVEDYVASFYLLADHADYIAVNVSTPNTPHVRKLQGEGHLSALLRALVRARDDRARTRGAAPRPLLLKISPDLDFAELDFVLAVVAEHGIDGIIATNTTLQRPGNLAGVAEVGGLSGRPLHRLSTRVIRYIHRSTGGKIPIIGVGGILDERTAGETMDAGASLVQVYSGLIFRGPSIARSLARALSAYHSDWK